jgi:hypothetical protein
MCASATNIVRELGSTKTWYAKRRAKCVPVVEVHTSRTSFLETALQCHLTIMSPEAHARAGVSTRGLYSWVTPCVFECQRFSKHVVALCRSMWAQSNIQAPVQQLLCAGAKWGLNRWFPRGRVTAWFALITRAK